MRKEKMDFVELRHFGGGDVRQDYVVEKLFSVSLGHTLSLEGVLKTYAMFSEGKHIWEELPNFYRDIALVKQELSTGKLNSQLGIGFAIFSNGFINASFWDKEYPGVIVPNVYTTSHKGIERVPGESVGAFCFGEGAIYNHERVAWKRFLNSSREPQRKLDYLNDFIEGELN